MSEMFCSFVVVVAPPSPIHSPPLPPPRVKRVVPLVESRLSAEAPPPKFDNAAPLPATYTCCSESPWMEFSPTNSRRGHESCPSQRRPRTESTEA